MTPVTYEVSGGGLELLLNTKSIALIGFLREPRMGEAGGSWDIFSGPMFFFFQKVSLLLIITNKVATLQFSKKLGIVCI